MLLDIDVKGGKSIMDEFPDDTIGIFIEPPGFDNQEKIDTLMERLQKRENSSETLIKQRLKRFELEMDYKEKFNFTFINDNFEKTTSAIEKKIKEQIK